MVVPTHQMQELVNAYLLGKKHLIHMNFSYLSMTTGGNPDNNSVDSARSSVYGSLYFGKL
ncbi:hypothetical protein X798_01516 [Onchocerca flexuosa]|uniref:Uncharacterized protein n=1 Tax=Onchocerca flexuosa TaxID=387005 RepID=A0A238C2H9_9BILA|nr:hypothetical protein X798_01516 [Onchocerca flexuosa]